MIKDRETRLALKIISIAAIFVILIWAIIKLAPIISLIVIAFFIVYTINPLVNFLVNIKFKPFMAAVAASLIIFVAVVLLFYLLIPGLIIEMRQLVIFLTTELIRDVPLLVTQLEEIDQRFNLQLASSFLEYSNEFMRQVPGNVQQLLRQLTALSMGVLSRIWVVLALIFLVFYLVQDLDKAKYNLTLIFPQIYKENIVHLMKTVDEKVGAYIRGTLMKCVFVGLLTWFGLSLLGMPFSLLLGILAGALNIILYIGPFVAAIPALLLSIMPGTPSILLVGLVYIVVQILDAFVFTPVFLGKATDLSPLTVIIIVLIGGQLMGLLGIILAIPITATLKVLLFHYYLDRRQVEENNHSTAK
ncbi:MAG: AI-2E family transporter [Bacillota bacterium]|nr:AI-2E family transporter [Bacillota bacterium]